MRMRVRGGLAAVLLVGCAAGAPKDAAPVTLRFRPAAGTVHRYAFEQRVTTRSDSGTPLPPQDVTLRIYLTQAVGPGGADGIPVTSTIDSVSLDNGALPASLDAMEGRVRGLQTLTVRDHRMRSVRHEIVKRAELDAGRLDAFEQGTSGLAFPLPEEPVRVGDSWTVTALLPTGQMLPGTTGPLEAATTLTVRQVRIAGSDTTVLLDIESRLPEAPLPVDLGIGQSSLRLSGTLAGEQEFSVSRGTVVRASLAGEIRVEMTGGIAGDRTMGMTLDQRLTIRMLEGP